MPDLSIRLVICEMLNDNSAQKGMAFIYPFMR